jgi:hypothetical protein
MTPRVLTPDDVVAFAPPADLCRRVLAQQYPDAAGAGDSWPGLLAATGRPPRHRRETANPTPA